MRHEAILKLITEIASSGYALLAMTNKKDYPCSKNYVNPSTA